MGRHLLPPSQVVKVMNVKIAGTPGMPPPSEDVVSHQDGRAAAEAAQRLWTAQAAIAAERDQSNDSQSPQQPVRLPHAPPYVPMHCSLTASGVVAASF